MSVEWCRMVVMAWHWLLLEIARTTRCQFALGMVDHTRYTPQGPVPTLPQQLVGLGFINGFSECESLC